MPPIESRASQAQPERVKFSDGDSAYRENDYLTTSERLPSPSQDVSEKSLPFVTIVGDTPGDGPVQKTDTQKDVFGFEEFSSAGGFANHPLLNPESKPKTDTEGKPEGDLKLVAGAEQKDELEIPDILLVNTAREPAVVEGAIDGSRWSRLMDGSWTFDDGIGGSDPEVAGLDNRSVSNVELLADKSVKLTLEDGEILRHRPDGSSIEFKDQKAFENNQPRVINRTDGTSLALDWQDNKLKSAGNYSLADNGKFRNSKTGLQADVSVNAQSGEISVVGDDGARTTTSTDGSVLKVNRDGSSALTLKSTQDGTRREFNFKNGSFENESSQMSQPDSMIVTTKDGSYTWQKIGDDKYNQNGTAYEASITVTRNEAGEYSYNFHNLDSGYQKTVDNQQIKEINPQSEEIRITSGGRLSGLIYDESEYGLKYDSKGELLRIEDGANDLSWTKDSSGKWQPSDSGRAEAFDAKIVSDPDLSAEQKVRMLENAKRIRKDSDFDGVEKEKFFNQVGRLLDQKEGTLFSEAERATLAEQTLWHTANDRQNDQGQHKTCNVTTLRGLCLKEQPSTVAKLVADIAETGQVVVEDGSVIKPPVDSLRPIKGTVEENFPPVSGNRTWLGQVWDVTALNVHFQRQTKDISGSSVKKGSLMFKQVASAGGNDRGERMVKIDDQGKEWTLHKSYNSGRFETYDGVRMPASGMLDIYDQLSGASGKGKMVTESSRYLGDKAAYEKLGGELTDSVDEFQEFLKKADFPVIVQLNTGIIKQRASQKQALLDGKDPDAVKLSGGGEHVVLIDGYQPPAGGESGRGTLSVDNSWQSLNDFLTPEEFQRLNPGSGKSIYISVEDMFNSMKRKVSSSSESFSWSWARRG